MDTNVPAKRASKDSCSNKERKRVKAESNDATDRDVASATSSFEKLVLDNLTEGETFTIKVEDQVLVPPRPLTEGVVATGELTSDQLEEKLKPFMEKNYSEEKMVMTRTEKAGFESFDAVFDLHQDKKCSSLDSDKVDEPVVNPNFDLDYNSTANKSNKQPSVSYEIRIVEDNEVPDLPKFEFEDTANFVIPYKEQHLMFQMKNFHYAEYRRQKLSKWSICPEKRQVLLNYDRAHPDIFMNSFTLKRWLEIHSPEDAEDVLHIFWNIFMRWKRSGKYGLSIEETRELTDAEKRMLQTRGRLLMSEFLGLENHENVAAIREALLFGIIENWDLLSDRPNLVTNLKNHEMKCTDDLTIDVFRKVLLKDRPVIRDLLFDEIFPLERTKNKRGFVSISATKCRVWMYIKKGLNGNRNSAPWTLEYVKVGYRFYTTIG